MSILSNQQAENDKIIDDNVRPLLLRDFTGQERVTKNIKIFLSIIINLY